MPSRRVMLGTTVLHPEDTDPLFHVSCGGRGSRERRHGTNLLDAWEEGSVQFLGGRLVHKGGVGVPPAVHERRALTENDPT
jgi:hypothetical protein